MRAVRREGALDALQPAVAAMLPDSPLGKALGAAFAKAADFARQVSGTNDDAHARQAATGLYYAAAAAILASEGTRLAQSGDARRTVLAALVHEHRLRPRDPLRPARGALERAFADALLSEDPVPAAEAARLVESFAL